MSKLTFRDDSRAPLLCLPMHPAIASWQRSAKLDYFPPPPRSSAAAVQQPWAGAQSWLRALTRKLRAAGWTDAPDAPRGLLLALDHRALCAPGSRACRTTRLRVPRRPDADTLDGGAWRALLEGEDVRVLRSRDPVLQDVVHVLQCLFPGRFVLVHGAGGSMTATPPPAWMRAHERKVKEIWGCTGYDRLLAAGTIPQAALDKMAR